ncbi:DUF4232 domain-containing protein [Sinomonas halotolerans]|uniref:DUF4232 domain-containing protein n=1 Tax=Sinomonas halotolerans TaxID=1644133 RepID=A0ABU9X086_9MICC
MTRLSRAAAVLSPLVLAAGLAGCGLPGPSATSPSPTTEATSPSPSASPSASSASPSASGTATKAAGGTARCLSTQLKGSLAPGQGGAAGTVYQKIVLKNVSKTACLLEGFAGVSLTAGPEGKPIGAPADRDQATAVTPVVLAPGESGAAEFGLRQARTFTGCTVVQAAGLRVYPPEDYGSVFIPAPAAACSNADIHLLTLRAFQPA